MAKEKSERDIVIRAIDVSRHYSQGDELIRALDGVTLDVFRGEYLSIMGPSGSGKSTLFNMIGGIDSPTQGMVLLTRSTWPSSILMSWPGCGAIRSVISFSLIISCPF